jgi:hypothetical protein
MYTQMVRVDKLFIVIQFDEETFGTDDVAGDRPPSQ